MNSPSTNLAWHYPSGPSTAQTQTQQQQKPRQQPRPAFNPITNQYDPPPPSHHFQRPIRANSNGSAPPVTSFPAANLPTPSDADLLLNLHSPYNNSGTGSSPAFPSTATNTYTNPADPHQSGLNDLASANWNYANLWNPLDFGTMVAGGGQPFGGDMMIESQDVDMSLLGLEMMPWFDGFAGAGGAGEMMFAGDGQGSGGGDGGTQG